MFALRGVAGAVNSTVDVGMTVGKTAVSPLEKSTKAVGSAAMNPVSTMKSMVPKTNKETLQPLQVGPRIAQYGFGYTVWGAGKRKNGPQNAFVIWRTEATSWSNPIAFTLDPNFDCTGWTALPFACVPPFYYAVAYNSKDLQSEVFTVEQILQCAPTYFVPLVTRDTTSIRIAAMSCRYAWGGKMGNFTNMSYEDSDKLYMKMVERGPYDLALMLGDQIYADPLTDKPGFATMASKSFSDYCDRYREGFSSHWFTQVVATTPTYMVIDDHEFWNDFNGVQSLTGPDKVKRYENALSAIRSYQYRVTERVSDPSRPELWYTFQHNAFRFFGLDCRTCRLGDSLLGAPQTAVFTNWLRSQPLNQISCVLSSVPLLPLAEDNDDYNSDKWSGFPGSLAALRQELDDSSVPDGQLKRIIFFTGDYHLSTWVTLLSPNRKISIHFIVASPVKAVMPRKAKLATKVPQYFDGWLINCAPENEIIRQDSLFTTLDIDFSSTKLEVYDISGTQRNTRSLSWGV